MAIVAETPVPSPSHGRRRRLREDSEGQFLLLGIPMVLIASSLLWYVVGMAQSILWRDRSQEVADSVALTSGACHAIGMNLIAFLNLAMLVFSLIHMILALLSMAMLGVAYLALACSFFLPAAEAISQGAFRAHDWFDKIDEKLVDVIEKVFPKVGTFEEWVAIGAPWWAFEASATNGLRYEDGGSRHYGLAFSTSMIPLNVFMKLQKSGMYKPSKCNDDGSPPDGYSSCGQPPIGWTGIVNPDGSVTQVPNKHKFIMPQDFEGKEGLPVFADKFNSLCTNSINLIPDYAYQLIHASQDPSAGPNVFDSPFFNNIFGQAVKQITRLMRGPCDDPFWNSGQYNGRQGLPYGSNGNTTTNPQTTDGQNDGNGDPACTPDGFRQMVNANAPPDPGPAPPQPSATPPDAQKDPGAYANWQAMQAAYGTWQKAKSDFDYFNSAQGKKDRTKAQQQICKQNGKTWSKQEEDDAKAKNQDKGPKYVINYAINGNDWMQIWAIAFGDPPGDATSGAQMAKLARLFDVTPADTDLQPPAAVYTAQAELYLDCHGRWFSVCNQFNLATFKVGWRSRLRRVELPDWQEIVGDLLSAALADVLTSDWMRDRFRQVKWPSAVTSKLPGLKGSMFGFMCKDGGQGTKGCGWGVAVSFAGNFAFNLLKTDVLYEANLLNDHHSPANHDVNYPGHPEFQGSLH